MPKSNSVESDAVTAQQVVEESPQRFEVTLDEFCRQLSATDKRVEMIAGFHFSERQAGTVKDHTEAFEARYADFINKPV